MVIYEPNSYIYIIFFHPREFFQKFTYHPCLVSLEKLHHLLSLFVPQEDMTTVTSTYYKLTLWAIKVDTLY